MTSDTLTSITTLGALKASGYRSRSVKDELRANLIGYLQRREPVFTGIIGYDQTVIPQIQNAIFGRHDIILLGLRGQAKSRLIRTLPRLLDEYIPAIAGTELNDEARTELDEVVAFLLETPVTVEIGGHTDSDGDEALNQSISQQRAEAVLEYLTGQGVPAESLTAVGYGETLPVAPNDTSENKALNRRIEFKTIN